MAFIEIPEMPVLQGEEAVELLNQMIEEFQQRKGKRLTDKQAKALTTAANQIICIIRTKAWTTPAEKPHVSSHLGFLKRFRSSQL